MSLEKDILKDLDLMIIDAITMIETIEPRNYLFPEFCKQLKEHLQYIKGIKQKYFKHV